VAAEHEERAMRWWGWGDPAHVSGLPDHVVGFLAGEVGIASELRPAVAIEDVAITEPALSADARAALAAAVGEQHVLFSMAPFVRAGAIWEFLGNMARSLPRRR